MERKRGVDNCPENLKFGKVPKLSLGDATEDVFVCPITGPVVIQDIRHEDGVIERICVTRCDESCKSTKKLEDEDDDDEIYLD